MFNREKGGMVLDINIERKEHILGDKNKGYFWTITANINGGKSIYSCGWAKSSEDAWRDANNAYKTITSML